MAEPTVRKIQLDVNRTLIGGGIRLDRPHRSGSVAAVVANPFVGSVPDRDAIGAWMQSLEGLAHDMAGELRDALAIDDYQVESYGKGGIVGVSGEIEIAAAWHAPAGIGLRTALGHPKAQVPSSKKVGALGCQIDIPLVYVHASYLRSHYDAQPVVVPDGPRPDEVVYALVMATGPRPNHRIGGFGIEDVVGDDGQR